MEHNERGTKIRVVLKLGKWKSRLPEVRCCVGAFGKSRKIPTRHAERLMEQPLVTQTRSIPRNKNLQTAAAVLVVAVLFRPARAAEILADGGP